MSVETSARPASGEGHSMDRHTVTMCSHPRPDPDAPTPGDIQAAWDLPGDKAEMLVAMAFGRRPVDIAAELGRHPRRLEAVVAAWSGKGWCEWGVSHRCAWLTEKGRRVAGLLIEGA